jgi:hypothetical protein
MDLSKLPKLSETPRPPPQPGPEAPRVPVARVEPAQFGLGAEAWISLAFGMLLLLISHNTLGYFSSKLFHTSFEPFPDPTRQYPARCDFILYMDGTKIFYRDTVTFWSDLVVTLFAITLILDGLILLRARRAGVILCALAVTTIATLANLFYLVRTISGGLPIISILAVIFGVYIAIYQWNLYKSRTAARAGA